MKKTVLLLLALFVCMTSASAADVASSVTSVKTSSTYSAPGGYEPKGYVGNIISQIFDPVGQILSNYVLAFQNILTVNNTVPVWNSTTRVFDVGSISQDGTGNVRIGSNSNSKDLRVFGNIIANNITDPLGNSFGGGGGKFIDGSTSSQAVYMTGNVGIGVNNPTEKLFVDGRISVTGTPNSLQDVGNIGYSDGRYINVGESIDGDSITDDTIDGSEIEDNSIRNSDIFTGAGIAGTKISPNFGTQNIVTEGTLRVGDYSEAYLWGYQNTLNVLPENDTTYSYNSAPVTSRNGVVIVNQTSNNASSADIILALREEGRGGNVLHSTRISAIKHQGNIFASDMTFSAVREYDAKLYERMRIEGNSGNVGIGTISPMARLDVNGKILMRSQTLPSDSIDTVATKGYVDSALGGGGGKFIDGSTSSQAVYMTGNVGIGVNNPTEKLFVDGRISVTGTPNSLQDVGNIGYNDGRYVNVGESIGGDTIADNTIDSSEIQNDTIVEADISNTFVARNSFLLGGRSLNVGSNGNTVVSRDGSGDINARLFRSEHDSTNSNIGYIMTQVDTAGNNYIRPSTPAQFRASVTDSSYINIGSSGDQIQDNTIDSSEIENGTITSTDIQNNSITAADIRDDAISCVTRLDYNRSVGSQAIRQNRQCSAGEVATGGGGNTYNGTARLQCFPQGNGWECYKPGGVDAGGEMATHVRCCKM